MRNLADRVSERSGDFTASTLSLAREWPPLLAWVKLVFRRFPGPYTIPTHHALFHIELARRLERRGSRFAHAEQ